MAMHRLHNALRNESIESTILAVFTNGLTTPDIRAAFGATGMFGARVSARLGSVARRMRADPKSHGCSVNILPNNLVKKINRLSPDIVHLHWLGANTLPIQDLRRIRAPVVWTLHDMWAFCGAEHYSFTDRWKTGYPPRSGAPLGTDMDVDAYVYRAKQRWWQGVPLDTVSPSTWMLDCVTSAALWRGRTDVRHHVIANGLPLNVFKPHDPLACRRKIGIPENTTVILFGAHHCDDSIKGVDLLAAAVPHLRLADRDVMAVTFGASEGPSLPAIGCLPTRHLGTVADPRELAQVYSCANVMVVPSRMESFCQTASESQACGIPVACFDATGLRDVVEHEMTGYRATPFEPAALAAGIEWCIANRDRRATLGKAARARAEALFGDQLMAEQYKRLYADILRRPPEAR